MDRHPEDFKGHLGKKGREITLDEVAVSILDEKYPFPQPIEVIPDMESKEKLLKAQEYIIKLQNELNEQKTVIAKAEALQYVLEDKTKQLKEKEEQNANLLQQNASLMTKNDELQRQHDADQEEMSKHKYKKLVFGLYRKE